MSLTSFLFWVLAAVTGISAIAVVASQNIVRSATWLLFTLAGVSGLFFLLGADFVGATQLLVYVGGTLVLVVFGVMLTAQGPFITMRTGPAEWAVSTVVGLVFLAVLVLSLLNASWPRRPDQPRMENARTSLSSTVLGEALLGIKEVTPKADLTAPTQTPAQKNRTQVAYLFPFEIVSVHLLVVLLGAAYLARAKRRRPAPLSPKGRGGRSESFMNADTVGLEPYLVLGALLFVCGAVCMATKRNAIGILIGVELVLNGANVNFVAFARYNPAFEVEGQIFALFVVVLAAAEAAIALAIVLNFYNNHTTVDVDTAEELKG